MRLWIRIKAKFFVGRNVFIGRNFHLGLLSWVSASAKLSIGDDVYIGKFCSIQSNGTIGDGVLIANNVGIVGRRDHDFREIGKFVSQAKWIGLDSDLKNDPRNFVTIEPDVWIGFGSIVLSGITIGRGAIVGAGSVVRADIAPYDVVSGNPATPIARRFTDEQIAEHEAALASKIQSNESSSLGSGSE